MSPVLVTDRARKDRSRTCRSMQNIRVSKSARSLRNTSLAQRRMMSVQCCVRQWNTARQTALESYLSVNCQDWVAMRLRCLPLSRNSLTVASTSKHLAISTNVSKFGCSVLVHHFETVPGSLPSCSASYLLVRFFSASTTFSRFISLLIHYDDLNLATKVIYFLQKQVIFDG